jgi:hypothetical protein
MVGLENANQDARVYKHALNAIRINALAADSLIAQEQILSHREYDKGKWKE